MATLEKIDIHNTEQKYLRSKERLLSDETITMKNRELLTLFLNDCAMGKTVKNRQKKKIMPRRLYKYLYHLKMVSRCIQKDFDKLCTKDMESFIACLEGGDITVLNFKGKRTKKKYSANTIRDIKIALKKFYKWLWGDCDHYPEIVAWFDTSIQEPEVEALSEEEIISMVDFAHTVMHKALVWTLYESGARSEEFINIRLCHVTEKSSHYVLRIEFPKTFKRSPPIYESPFRAKGLSYLRQWLEQHPNKEQSSGQLFPISYKSMNNLLQELGSKALGRKVNPHLLRDSRATYLARKKVGRYQMCKLMGWSMSSRMPDRYIDRAGVTEEEAMEAIRRDDLAKSEETNMDLKRKLLELESRNRELENLSVNRSKADNIMNTLLKDKEVQDALSRKIRELGLADDIIGNRA